MLRVLVVDDEPAIRRVVTQFLKRDGWEVTEAEDGVDGLGKVQSAAFDLVITDLRMPRLDGAGLLRAIRQQQPELPVVILTAHGSIADCVTAMKAGASSFLNKPFHGDDLIRTAREAAADAESHPATAQRSSPQVSLIGESPSLRAVLDMVAQVARTDATALLHGETGTGKEVMARLLHGSSKRAGGPFVAVNCGAIPEGLIESELFGHAKGAFTGASEKRVGRFVQANSGTLFLDEIGDLPLAMQVRLLRVLQERQVTPVGDPKSVPIDVRVVAATHRDLEQMVAAGQFRQDLFFRLNVVVIEIPPLRERREDIPLLAGYFLDAAARRYHKPLKLAGETLAMMAAYRWPGNVRELENLVERLAILTQSDVIAPEELPAKLRETPAPGELSLESAGAVGLTEALEQLEDRLIQEALRKSEGNQTQAAKLLGLNRTTLTEKLRRRRKP